MRHHVLSASVAGLVLLGLAGSCVAFRSVSQNGLSPVKETPCEACTQLISLAKAYVSNPSTQQRILSFTIKEVCPRLPEADRQYCAIYAPLVVAAASAWIQERQAIDICGQARLCSEQGTLVAAEARTPTDEYVAAMLRCPLVAKRLTEVSEQHSLPLRDDCDTCKIAVIEAASILGDPGTQKELLDYAKQACNVYPDFHDQCLTYVEMYGPLVLNAAVAYMTPDLCVELGVCSSA